MEAPPVSYVRTQDGYDLAYCDVGTGLPVVLLPGRLNSMAYTWYRWASWFAPLREGNRFVSFDARGQGLSTRGLREGLAVEDYVSDVALVLDHLKLPEAILVAHGNGGHVAVRYATQHPDRVSALVLVSVTVNIEAWNMSLWQGVAGENWELFLRSLIPRSLPPEAIEERLTRMKAIETHSDYMRAQQAMAAAPTIEHLLPSVQVPTLVIHPRDYLMIPVSQGTRLAGGIPGARLVMIPGQADELFGNASELAAALKTFLSEMGPGSSAPAPTSETVAAVKLSPRETEVLHLIAAGRSNQQIADELVLSLRTVERHITNLYGKIGAHGKADATAYALRHVFTE
jgi:pimeloyl-ACP methyl ester carboxylesterase/DNA-binding CsgD family transcriptional regulator